jgi:diguanylate cyclase (GGDEF)-like protein
MNDARSYDRGQRPVIERLLEDSWEARARRASRRELVVEATAGALFLAATGGLLAPSAAGPPVGLELAGLLVALYALVARVEFPVGTGHAVPTQLVLVPMLVVLPPAVVPVAVVAGLLVSTAIDWLIGRVPARRMVSAVPDAWHALGPALVFVAAGSPSIGWTSLPLMVAAFGACCLLDFASSLVRMRLVGTVPDVRLQARVMVSVWAIDACLAPVGFVAAIATEHAIGAVLVVIPLAVLLWMLARDRRRRIEHAHSRLKLLERERSRLQSAVRRLGDAFAAKLELNALLEILLHGTLEALDGTAGQLELASVPSSRRFAAGPAERVRDLQVVARGAGPIDAAVQVPAGQAWALMLPVAIDPTRGSAPGVLALARDQRAFQDDEIALLSQLIAKAEQAAAEILANQALRELAVTDALTGLGNRRRLTSDLSRALERAAQGRPALLLLFDLDGFKAYNDTFGHLAGDALLTRLGAKLSDVVGPSGGAYRLGGDEFCALFDVNLDDVDALIARAAAALCESGSQFSVGASLGAVLLPHEANSPDYALQLADERMYATKRGRPAGPLDQARDVLIRTMQAKQPDLDEHANQVATLAVRVARKLGLAGEALDEVARAAELHDIGKVGIPDAILRKPAPLDDGEWEFMRQHPVLGERILNAAPALRPIAPLVRASHERWDGTGYPDGLAGADIPLAARIVAVCDAYEAMTADRAYRSAMPHKVACQELQANAGTQFDPSVVDAFLTVVDAFLAAVDPRQGAHRDDTTQTPVEHVAAHVRGLLRQPPTALTATADVG